MVALILANKLVFAMGLIGVLDCFFVFNPNLKANGTVHFIYLTLQSIVSPDAPKSS